MLSCDSKLIFLFTSPTLQPTFFSATWRDPLSAHGPAFPGWKPPGVYSMDLSGSRLWIMNPCKWFSIFWLEKGPGESPTINHLPAIVYIIIWKIYEDLVIIHQAPKKYDMSCSWESSCSKNTSNNVLQNVAPAWDGKINFSIWVFPKIMVPPNHPF